MKNYDRWEGACLWLAIALAGALLGFSSCAATTKHGAQTLMELAHPPGVIVAASNQKKRTAVAPVSIIPLPIVPTNVIRRAAAVGQPPASPTRVYEWDIPAWLPYETYQMTRQGVTRTNYLPATWLERVTALGATNWKRCSSNVPININTRTVRAVVTNLPIYFLRSTYGWQQLP